MNTQEIAHKLAAYCKDAKWETAQKELYADDAVSIEPQASPAFAKETKGLAAIIEKGHKFDGMVEKIHSLSISAPMITDNSFAFMMSMDMTMKGQPRMKMSEICVYEVKNGKIVSEQFFM